MPQNWCAKFKKNKRGYYSFLIFLTIFFLTLSAEFICNDKPLFVSFKGEFYFPIFQKIPESKFAESVFQAVENSFETPADYRDEAVQNMIAQNGFMIWPLHKFSYDTINYNITSPAPAKPTSENILGTDDNGRDVLARVIYGIRISLLFGIILTFFSVVIAVFLGAIQGYFGGWLDIFLQRIMEIWSAMPVLFLLIILSSIIEPGFFTLLGLMLLFSWMALVGYVRAQFYRLKNFEYVMAAKVLGASNWRIIFKHILPNASPIIIANLPFLLSASIVTLTSLDFLGLGMPIGAPSLGELLAQGKNNLTAWWLGVTGFVVIASILTMLIFMGEALRDAFDVRRG